MGYYIQCFILTAALITAARTQQTCGDLGATETVNIRLNPAFNLPSRVIQARLGRALTLNCIAAMTEISSNTFINIMSYTWYHNGDQLNITSSNLQIPSVRGADGGVYECTATSDTCTTQRSPEVNVTTPPDVTILEPSGAIITTVTGGTSFTLRCQATGWPQPQIQWLRIVSGSNTVIQNGLVYTVNSASPTDQGQYICHASNNIGSSNSSIVVQYIASPTGSSNMTNLYVPSNSTDFRDFGIAIGVTAGVSVILTVLTLLCCFITLYINCCRKETVDEDNDWPDGRKEQVLEDKEVLIESKNEDNSQSMRNPVEEGDEGRSVVAASPSEVGEMI